MLRFLLPVFVFVACSSGKGEKDENVLATVYDKNLTLNKVLPLIPEGINPEDSVAFVKGFVESWIRDMVIVHQAEKTLPEETLNVEARLENYRRSLLVYAYEQEYARQKLDTIVSDEEIEAHYEANKDDFRLADFIVKVLFVKLVRDQPGKANVAKWYKSTQQKDLMELEKFCVENAVSFYNDSESWIYLSDLMQEIPIRTDDRATFLKTTQKLEFEDEEFAYFLLIHDYRLKDALSPLSFERENIKSRILNARTNEIVRKMRTDLLNSSQSQIRNYVEN
ncbi:MAG: hypothetical protein ACK40M_13430 [Flavobacteriales bacterium]